MHFLHHVHAFVQVEAGAGLFPDHSLAKAGATFGALLEGNGEQETPGQ